MPPPKKAELSPTFNGGESAGAGRTMSQLLSRVIFLFGASWVFTYSWWYLSYDRLRWIREEYLGECVGIMFIALYGTVYYVGMRANARVAQSHVEHLLPMFKQNFSQVGIEYNGKKQIVYAESKDKLLFYATGRRYCKGFLAIFELFPRQDLVSIVLAILTGSDRSDFLSVEIPMNDVDMDNFVFSVVKRAHLPALKSVMHDLNTFPRQVPLELLPTSLCCLTDMDDLIVYFLPADVIKLIRSYETYLEMMHLSDQNVISPFASATTPTVARKSLRFRFKLPPAKQDLEALIGLVLRTLDLTGEFTMSQDTKAKQLRRREELNTHGRESPLQSPQTHKKSL